MLCNAIAIASAAPTTGSSIAATNVARPSGKLCKAIANAVITPIFFNLICLKFSHEVTSVNGSGQTPVPATSGADEEGKEYTATPETSLENFKQIKLKKMGVMTALAIALHNLPEGLATFVAAMDDPVVGAALAIAIALHNIPEGICVSVPIYFSTGDRHKAFGWAFLSGISELIGAALGWIVLSQAMNDLVYGLLFGLVAGMMVYICIYQLQPTAHRYDPEDTIVTATTVTGMAIMAASLVLFLY
jgi:ZIP family zinc transporter